MKLKCGWLMLMAGICGGAWASEPGCYRTAEAAAAQAGVRGVDGYRLEGRRRDVFSGAVWATVKSCAHPERPGIMVIVSGEAGRSGVALKHDAAAMILLAGSKVTLVEMDDFVRIEMQGVAQGSGALGDRIKVRLVAVSADGGERFVDGIVRGSDWVEVAAR